MWGRTDVYVAIPEAKAPSGRPVHRGEDITIHVNSI
jgi:hypothetical protein